MLSFMILSGMKALAFKKTAMNSVNVHGPSESAYILPYIKWLFMGGEGKIAAKLLIKEKMALI